MDLNLSDDVRAYIEPFTNEGIDGNVFKEPVSLNSSALHDDFKEHLKGFIHRLDINGYDCEYEIKLRVKLTRRD